MSSCDSKKTTLVAVLSGLGGHEGETPWVTIKDSDGKFSFPAQHEDEPTYAADACTATPTPFTPNLAPTALWGRSPFFKAQIVYLVHF